MDESLRVDVQGGKKKRERKKRAKGCRRGPRGLNDEALKRENAE